MAHTPGPWIDSIYENGWTCIRERSHQGQIIAKLSLNNEDNAKLIAAAPELLEALDPDTLEAIADEIQSFEHSARAESLRSIARTQRATIKKATGETD